MVRTQISHHGRVNAIAALIVTPTGRRIRLITRLHRQNLSGKQILAFLRLLLKSVRGEIVMLRDNHPIHQRKTVTEFITKHPRLHVYNFPA